MMARIALEDQGRIFEMFQKLENRDDVEGKWIGLAYVKKTDIMLGRVWVVSELRALAASSICSGRECIPRDSSARQPRHSPFFIPPLPRRASDPKRLKSAFRFHDPIHP